MMDNRLALVCLWLEGEQKMFQKASRRQDFPSDFSFFSFWDVVTHNCCF